jgi:hypothetical protein
MSVSWNKRSGKRTGDRARSRNGTSKVDVPEIAHTAQIGKIASLIGCPPG